VRAHVPHATPITRLVFALGEHEREASWRQAAARVGQVVAEGRTAALATIGDPNVYSTFTYLAAAVRADTRRSRWPRCPGSPPCRIWPRAPAPSCSSTRSS
jgi:precorrin-2 methylase